MSPIKDASRYPDDWPAIRAAILKRAELTPGIERCECLGECGGNHQTARGRCPEVNGRQAHVFHGRVILTIGHLNHTPEDCRDSNLRAWCQRCHNRYDRPHRNETARKTREAKRGLMPLFESKEE